MKYFFYTGKHMFINLDLVNSSLTNNNNYCTTSKKQFNIRKKKNKKVSFKNYSMQWLNLEHPYLSIQPALQ